MTAMAWPTFSLYLDTTSAPLSATDYTNNITNLTQRTDIGSLVLSFQTTSGRSNSQSYFNSSTLTITLDNQAGTFDPTYTTSPYYPNLGIGNHITLTATPSGGSSSPIFSGYIQSITPTYSFGYEQVVITAADMFNILGNSTWQPSSAVAAQTADARCQQILTDLGFSSNWVLASSPAPTSLCAAIPVDPTTGLMTYTATALSAMQGAAHDTEDGMVYARGDGRLVVASRMIRPAQTGAPSVTFGDGAGETPYETDILIATDDALLINGMTVTDANSTNYTYSSAASIALYGQYFGSVTTLSATPNEGYDEAAFRVQTADQVDGSGNRQHVPRVDQINVYPVQATTPGDFSSTLPAAPGWQFESSTCTVKRRPGSGNTISINCFVERVNQSWDGVSWQTSLGVSNLTQLSGVTANWLLLNDATKGKIGTGVLGR